MKAKELRLDNYVYFTDGVSNVAKKVDTRMLAFMVNSERLNQTVPFIPILLTEEILLRCGFDVTPYDDGSGNGRTAKTIGFEMNKGNNWEFWNYSVSGGDYEINGAIIDVKNIHQLQNLYFALIGQELTISL